MPRLSVCLLACAVLAAAVPAFADTSIATPSNAVNALGQPVSARAVFTIHPDSILVRVTNTSDQLSSFHQTLRGISFTIRDHAAKGSLVLSRGRIATISAGTAQASSDEQDTRWNLSTKDNTFTLQAPGTFHTILPQADLAKADKSITDTPANGPYVLGSGTFQILTPHIDPNSDIVGVTFLWSDDMTPPGSKLTKNSQDQGPHGAAAGGGGDPLPYTSGGDGNIQTSLAIDAGPGASNDWGGDPGGGSSPSSNNTPAAQQPTSPTEPVTPPAAPLDLTPVFEAPAGGGPNAPLPPDATPIITPPSDGTPNPPLPTDSSTPSATDPTTPLALGTPQPVPEPGTLAILGLGAIFLTTSARSRRKS